MFLFCFVLFTEKEYHPNFPKQKENTTQDSILQEFTDAPVAQWLARGTYTGVHKVLSWKLVYMQELEAWRWCNILKNLLWENKKIRPKSPTSLHYILQLLLDLQRILVLIQILPSSRDLSTVPHINTLSLLWPSVSAWAERWVTDLFPTQTRDQEAYDLVRRREARQHKSPSTQDCHSDSNV